jgi:hypothetical protein
MKSEHHEGEGEPLDQILILGLDSKDKASYRL